MIKLCTKRTSAFQNSSAIESWTWTPSHLLRLSGEQSNSLKANLFEDIFKPVFPKTNLVNAQLLDLWYKP